MLAKRRGLTMTEAVVVMVLAVIVVGLFVVFANQARRRTPIGDGGRHAMNNLKFMALAVHNHHGTYRRFPPAWGSMPRASQSDASIHFHLLPFVEQDNLYRAYSPFAAVPPYQAILDPTNNDGGGVQNFAANLRVFSKLGQDTAYNADIAFGDPLNRATWDKGNGEATFKTFTDGTGNVIIFATRYANTQAPGIVNWAGNATCSAHSGRPYHDNGAFFGGAAARTTANPSTRAGPTFQLQPSGAAVDCTFSRFAHSFYASDIFVAIADGSVRRLSASISAETWNRVMQPNDGLLLGADWDE